MYPRTKIGTFTLLDPKEIVPFTTMDIWENVENVSVINTVDTKKDQIEIDGANM